ncbi:DNA mismatch repair endonuclease MutL [Peptoniphilus indolicus]|uniref:DNA mismatch repair protein MutL n=2 Tax=Peptoniphilus indolicus TaxID=33030 RepID=G4D5L9_9FIRM|nr:DNA mismatch repair endonuclease MutL [Peptoniphilus indolicus]EGY78639.1 DNA mismatch repair protein MutL [Peptoniphilus indolicus ATCC 29427]SUB76089.1 DNA mismatch repair protein mutL [Peptoniphilus indolicus]
MTINILDDLTISKIAAGEIIENPASIVKELVENSIDAEAKNIVVEVKGAPWEYIKVSDDGMGILSDEIEKAFYRHATSKLSNFKDLTEITSLGFRGEALASIASVSKIEVLTKTKNDLAGTRAKLEDGKIWDKKNIGVPVGTTFYITDVFHNTPVRKKFLKKESSEFNLIQDVVKKISLGTPEVSFKLIRDSRVILSKSATTNMNDHIFSILGRDISNNLINKKFENERYKINAFFSNNALYRTSRSEQYIYINGRFIRNLEISKSIERAYYSQIPLGRYPVFIIYLEIDPSIVDVNVHPKKHEVKFSNDEVIVQLLKDLAEETLKPNRDFIKPIEDEPKTENVNIFELFTTESSDNDQVVELDYTSNFINSKKESIEEPYKEFLSDNNHDMDKKEPTIVSYGEYNQNLEIETIDDSIAMENIEPFKKEVNLIDSRYVGSLFNTYLILESRDNRWFLIDQHAAHERVKYEEFLNQFNYRQVDSQMLLKPEIFDVSNVELDKFDEFTETLNKIGFEIEKFSDNSLIVRAIPSIVGCNFEDFLRQSLQEVNENLTSAYQVNPYALMKKACKAAVKANEKLSSIEVKQLVKDLVNCEDPYTCPHGRPTVLELTKRDLEKMFLRG